MWDDKLQGVPKTLQRLLPENFDSALITPGMQIFRPNDLAENVPYNVLVSNSVQHIGMRIMNHADRFGSAGRLKSVIYESFSSIDVIDHEVAHTWGAGFGYSLGLLQYYEEQGHWNDLADMQGQLGAYYFNEAGDVGHFAYNDDQTWHPISNLEVEPYSPLELYMMGLIPPDEVPPIHILKSPNTCNVNHITAASYRTITIEDMMLAEGGARAPSAAESQKDFNLAYIVTQDIPYNDSAYALMTKDPPPEGDYATGRLFAPFYWATGGRGTLNTRLP